MPNEQVEHLEEELQPETHTAALETHTAALEQVEAELAKAKASSSENPLPVLDPPPSPDPRAAKASAGAGDGAAGAGGSKGDAETSANDGGGAGDSRGLIEADPVAQALRDERTKRYGVSLAAGGGAGRCGLDARRGATVPPTHASDRPSTQDALSDAQKLQAARSKAAMEDALKDAFKDDLEG